MPLLFLSHVLYSTLIDWLMFKSDEFDWFALNFKYCLAGCAGQLLYNLSLIKLCSACAIKNTSDACSLLAK